MQESAYFVGPWDLNRALACVPARPEDGGVVLVESVAKGSALPYHRKKLTLVLSAMRHFAEELRAEGYDVELVQAPTYVEGLASYVARRGVGRVVAMEPREWGLREALLEAQREPERIGGATLELRDDGGEGGHFLLPRGAFAAWAEGRKTLRMDHFYRWMRKREGILLDANGKPEGGSWSLDKENRKTPPAGVTPPEVARYAPDAITREAMAQVAGWSGRWGSVDGFDWPVTRAQALEELEAFVVQRGARYGDYQDAMLRGEPYMWHARLSAAMNLSLLHPREVIARMVRAWEEGAVPLNAAEGFVRQVLGWREFIRGVYWLRMPKMRHANTLEASRPLPAMYWDETQTDMACMRASVGAVREHGYAHHIQRLMVLGNYALLAGLAPLEVSRWFWAGFVDAYEWVELPNVHGMALYADDGFTTKPYAASGSYIHRMSDYCGSCPYDVKARTGDDACPFNALYWDFMVRHRERLSANPRVAVIFRAWDRWEREHQEAILETAARHLARLAPAEHDWRFEDDAC